jgi:hydroxymethylpyrimidine pyrophosphatase-like HAD family hydrolase
LINNNGVLIRNSQIEGNIINAKGAPYKKAKRFYETSQKFQESWAINFHGQNGQRDDGLLQFVVLHPFGCYRKGQNFNTKGIH